jgi:hypothetical protein
MRLTRTINLVHATTIYTYTAPVLTAMRDTRAYVTRYPYGGADRLAGTLDPTNTQVSYGDHVAGNTRAITTPLDYNNLLTNTIETRGYDALNRIIRDIMGGHGERTPANSIGISAR